MPKPKKPAKQPVCGRCMEFIDLDAVLRAIALKEELKHDCGRVLVKGPLG